MTVDHGGARSGLSPNPLSVCHNKTMVDAGEDALIAPATEVIEDRALGRHIAREQPPADHATQNVENGVDDLAERPFERSSHYLRLRQQRFESFPFRVG